MSYSDKDDQLNMGEDSLNIKKHLNTSFELSRISVSEDLILRTLNAIKEQSTVNENTSEKTGVKQPGSKVISWNRHVRGFAAVCAAVILVVTGYAVISQFPVGMKTANDSTTQNYSMVSKKDTSERIGTTAESNINRTEAPTTDTSAVEEADNASYESTDKYSLMADPKGAGSAAGALADDYETGSDTSASSIDQTDSGTGVDATAAASNRDDMSISSEGITEEEQRISSAFDKQVTDAASYTFRDIFVPSPEQAGYIIITDNRDNTSVTLSEQSEINAFYELMDDHEFTDIGVDNTGSQDFSVEMKSLDTQMLYTMLVGNYLTVRYIQGDTVSERICYAVENELFQGDIETLYLRFSK